MRHVFVGCFGMGKLGLAFARHPDGRVRVQRARLQAAAAGCRVGDVLTAVGAQPLLPGMTQADVTALLVGAARPFEVTFEREVAPEPPSPL